MAIARRETPSYGAAAVAVPVLMLFLLVQQLRWLLYRCSESVAAAVIMADGQIAHARDESVYQLPLRRPLAVEAWRSSTE